MKPLEERFPTLYYDIVHEREAGSDVVKEKRKAKGTAPNLFDAIQAVCSVHRVTDTLLMQDLAGSVTEFLGLKESSKEEPEEEPEARSKRRTKKSEDDE